MGEVKEAVESRRNELISKLIKMEKYKTNETNLFELSLSDLEYTFYKNQLNGHPHGGMDSIRWRK
ncbi:Fur-regulated basic protein FbpA [Bacillus salacetis]|uniref:Fur-regulated basic protein FbpA n=1 Tax=Bacillus salacetis TaxID=2315464 RepID=A0A3A1QZR8_9BACI|nr:Fur-regulated basic protein FbpA [Bacillus salacetis]RIW34630.1 Fur-regulated basic protein FbpA [Bacillus salacetis]